MNKYLLAVLITLGTVAVASRIPVVKSAVFG